MLCARRNDDGGFPHTLLLRQPSIFGEEGPGRDEETYRDEHCWPVEQLAIRDGRGGEVAFLCVVKVDCVYHIIAIFRHFPYTTTHHLPGAEWSDGHTVTLSRQFEGLAVLELVAPRLAKGPINVVLSMYIGRAVRERR